MAKQKATKTPSTPRRTDSARPRRGDGVKRLYRLLHLIYLMQREPLGVDEMMVRLGISRATFFRCLKQLDAAEVPYAFDAESGAYRIYGEWFLQPLNFTFDEALALLAQAPVDSGPWGGHPALATLHSGMLKLANALPASFRSELLELLPRVQHSAHPQPVPTDHDFYPLAVDAFRRRRMVKARYYSVREDAEFDTALGIHAVFFHRHSWYVMAHSSRDGGMRVFKLSRFLSMTTTSARFARDPDFSLNAALGGAWGIIAGEGAPSKVSIRFTGRGAQYARETRWHAAQKIIELPNRECRLEVTVTGFDELIPWILSWGPLAVVEEPETLQLAIREELTKTLAAQPPSL